MSTSATYVDEHSFTVSGNQTDKFDSGRKIRCNHTNRGERLVYVNYSTYSDPNTTVYTIQANSEDLYSDLTSIDFSSIKPDTANIGNIPFDFKALQRGLRKYMEVTVASATTLYVGPGIVHIDNGTNRKLCFLPSEITLSGLSLSASTWHYLLVEHPTNGLVLTSSQFTLTTTAPTFSSYKKGWYDAGGTKRAIMFFKTDSDSEIIWFQYANGYFQYGAQDRISTPTLSTSWQTVTIDCPLPSMVVRVSGWLLSAAANYVYIKHVSDPDDYAYVSQGVTSGLNNAIGFLIPVDSNKQIYAKTSTSTATLDITAFDFIFPPGFFYSI